jgi:predicted transcriptional regulator
MMQIKDLKSLYIQSPKLNHLNILREIKANARITQAELANLCSLSVAMVNNYMKELCGTGWIEYHRKSSKNVSYHLTPLGKSYLDSLQMELIREMARLFEEAKQHVQARIVSSARSSLKRVVLFGTGNLAQLVFHALELAGARIVGVCDDSSSSLDRDFCGREVIRPNQIRYIAPDAIVVADSSRTEEISQNLAQLCGHEIEIIRLDSLSEQGSEKTETPENSNIGDTPVAASGRTA